MNYLKQSTAATVKAGPIVATDGVTPKTDLTIAASDVKISKSFGSIAAKSDATGGTHDAGGNYAIPLNTTDTGTVGPLRIYINGTGAMPFWEDYFVLAANVYDALVGSDLLQSNTTKIGGTSQTPKDLGSLTITGGKVDVNDKTGFGLVDNAITAAKVATDAITALQSGLATLTNQTTLLNRLTASRAGYLDALNITGVVASHTDVDAINQSASRRIILTTVGQYERPESGSTTYQVQASLYTADGALVNADTTPTLTATGISSGSLAASLGAATNPSTGIYRWTYTVTSTATLEQIRFDIAATIASDAQVLSCYSQVCDFVAATFTTADRDKLAAIDNKTTNLPSDPADESLIEAAITSAVSSLATSSSVAAVKAILDKVNTMLEADNANYRLTVASLVNSPSAGSAPTVSQIADGVWDEFLADHEAVGSAGEALATAGAGGIPPATQAQIDDILGLVTALQGTSVIHVSSPIGSDGTVSMITAYDYKAAQGMAVTWVNPAGSWPDLTGATVKVVNFDTRAEQGGTITVVTPTGANQTVRWDIAKTTYPTTGKGASKYILEATLAGGNKVPLAVGNLILR